ATGGWLDRRPADFLPDQLQLLSVFLARAPGDPNVAVRARQPAVFHCVGRQLVEHHCDGCRGSEIDPQVRTGHIGALVRSWAVRIATERQSWLVRFDFGITTATLHPENGERLKPVRTKVPSKVVVSSTPAYWLMSAG